MSGIQPMAMSSLMRIDFCSMAPTSSRRWLAV